MKNEMFLIHSNHSNNQQYQSKSSLPSLNLPKREYSLKERKLKLKRDDKYVNPNGNNIKQFNDNKNKDTKFKLKSVKIVSSSLSINKNPRTASGSPIIRKGNRIFLKPSPPNNIQQQSKPKNSQTFILRELEFGNSKVNYKNNTNDIAKENENNKWALPLEKSNYKKKYRIRTEAILNDLIKNSIQGNRNNDNKNENNSPIFYKGFKKKSNSLSLNISSNTNTNTNFKLNIANNNSNTNTDPIQQSQQSQIIAIREYSFKENPNFNSRKTMEDFHYINQTIPLKNNEHISLYAIFDGHNGPSTAIYCQKNIERLIKQYLKDTSMNIEDSLSKTFIELDEEIKKVQPDITACGTTATVVLIYKNTLYCANVGDSSCFIFQSDNSIKMTQDHNLKDANEVKRIKSKGGMIFNERVFGTLNLSRVLGDIEMKEYGVIPNPSIQSEILSDKDKYVILGSDGVWNYFNEYKILSIIKKDKDINADKLSEKIVQCSLQNGSLDNISCIVIKL